MKSEKVPRLSWVDLLRGLAILTMVPANVSSELDGPHPLWFGLLSSLAAPTFICISAGMVMLPGRQRPLRYYVARGGVVILVGCLIDVLLWRETPFTGFDVLYLIGLAIPVTTLVRQWPTGRIVALGLAIVASAPFLRSWLGYDRGIPGIKLWALGEWSGGHVLDSWLINGWFPIFPWLGLGLCGAALFRIAFRGSSRTANGITLAGVIMCAIGIPLLFAGGNVLPGPLEGAVFFPARDGFVEVFYPAVSSFVVTSLGVITLLTGVLMRERVQSLVSRTHGYRAVAFMGRHSLIVYVMHLVIGLVIIGPAFEHFGLPPTASSLSFWGAIALTFGTLYLVCRVVDSAKERHPPRNLLTRIVLGS